MFHQERKKERNELGELGYPISYKDLLFPLLLGKDYVHVQESILINKL